MAGDYEIFQAISVGKREVVLGENRNAEKGERFLCAFCETNELFCRYDDARVSDDYLEILGLFGQRVQEQAEVLRIALSIPEQDGIDDSMVTGENCLPLLETDDLNGKVIVISPDTLKREYQRATHQYYLCTGGFGASPNSRGRACFCTSLYDGSTTRFDRSDVLGITEKENLPHWAAEGLDRAEKHKNHERECR